MASVDEIVAGISEVTKISLNELASPSQRRDATRARAIAALLVRESKRGTFADLGRTLGRTAGAMSRAAQRLSNAAATDSKLSAELARARRSIL